MKPVQIRTEQPIAAKRRRGSGRPFSKGDPRINRGGVPSDVRAFHNWMREEFAEVLQEVADDGLTNGEHIIRTLVQMAMEGNMRAIEYVLDRMGGKPQQSVEVSTKSSYNFNFMSEADRIRALESVKRIKRMMEESPLELVSTTAEPGAGETLGLPDAVVGNTPPGENVRANNFQNADTPPRLTRKTCAHGLHPSQCVICCSI